MRTCPLCHKPLIKQSAQDASGYEPDWYCSEEISFPKDKRVFNHYRECPDLDKVTLFVDKFRIVNEDNQSKIGIHKQYKTKRGRATNSGMFYFKTVISCPILHVDTHDKLLNRIKLLLLMS